MHSIVASASSTDHLTSCVCVCVCVWRAGNITPVSIIGACCRLLAGATETVTGVPHYFVSVQDTKTEARPAGVVSAVRSVMC